MLALAGGVLGLLLANAGTGLLLRVSSGSVPLPRLNDVHVDRLVLPFATAISLGSSLIFGLVPAWQATRVYPQGALRQGGARGLLGGRFPRLRNGLVIAQLALSFVLTAGQYGSNGSNGSYAVEGKQIFAPRQRLPHAGFELAKPFPTKTRMRAT